MSDGIRVRRAGRKDVPAIAALVGQATPSELKIGESEVTEWLFGKGLLVAIQDNAVVGVAAWQAENLLSVTDVFQVAAEHLRDTAGVQLLAVIEEEARILMCEANVLLLPAWAPSDIRTFLQGQGYESRELADLHHIWQEVLGDFLGGRRDLMVKQLRDRMIMVPI
jgi:N-acetylglutamate synthase-like GNAT family acetyltransferase